MTDLHLNERILGLGVAEAHRQAELERLKREFAAAHPSWLVRQQNGFLRHKETARVPPSAVSGCVWSGSEDLSLRPQGHGPCEVRLILLNSDSVPL